MNSRGIAFESPSAIPVASFLRLLHQHFQLGPCDPGGALDGLDAQIAHLPFTLNLEHLAPGGLSFQHGELRRRFGIGSTQDQVASESGGVLIHPQFQHGARAVPAQVQLDPLGRVVTLLKKVTLSSFSPWGCSRSSRKSSLSRAVRVRYGSI